MTPDKKLMDECGPFAIVPQWLLLSPEATDRAIRLYLTLWTYTTDGKRIAFPSRKTLGELMGCGKKKVDHAVTELVAAGAITITPRVRPGTTERSSNVYGLIRTNRTEPFCLTCGHTEVGCKCSLRREQMDTTWPPDGYHGGEHMDTAEVEPPKEEPLDKNQLASLCDTSQAKVSGDDQEIKRILGGRSLPKVLPCEPIQFVRLMQQMSRDCFCDELHRITQNNYNEVKRHCKDLAEWLVTHHKPVDPAYLYAFCFYYQNIGHDRFEIPKPLSYTKLWDDEDFWQADFCMKRVDEYRDALALDPHRPLMCHYVWPTAP
jgi:hypothetical protein